MHVEIEIATFCPFKCAHCYITEGALKRRTSVFDNLEFCKIIIEKLCENGASEFTITGGEPSIHRNFRHLVELIARHNKPIELYTNGILGSKFWSDEIYLESINKIQITMYGFSTGTYRLFTKNASGFAKAKCFVEKSLHLGKSVSIQMPNVSALSDDIIKIEPWARSLGIPINLFDVTIFPRSYDPIKEQEIIGIENNNIDGLTMICGAGTSSIRISSDGKLKGCQLHSSGIKIHDPELMNLYLQSLRNVTSKLASSGSRFCGASLELDRLTQSHDNTASIHTAKN